MEKIKDHLKLFWIAMKQLGRHQPLILASSTAFFTIFSIPPMLIIVINILSLQFKSENISYTFYAQIESIFGSASSEQVQIIAGNFSAMASSPWITVAGSAFLIFVATNLFKVIRMSINQIWQVRIKRAPKLWYKLKDRSIALGIIFLTGIFFLLSTLSDSFLSFLDKELSFDFFNVDTLLLIIVSKIISVFFIAMWFMALFRYLPSGRLHWKGISVGAIVTAILFSLGKLALERFLVNSNIDNVFETSTSIVLIMLFIFYSSLIMYYGASFTLIYSNYIGIDINPRKNAQRFEVQYIEDTEEHKAGELPDPGVEAE